MGEFDDIRPYNDAEVTGVVKKLLKNDEFFNAISGFQLPKIKKISPWFARVLVKQNLKKKIVNIQSISDFQNLIAIYVEQILKRTTTSLVESGLNESSNKTAHLFMSNHRDIVMDPALISYLLHGSVHGTIQIAIGDNLLKKEYISDLMRLNKSFIVKRSAKGREKLLALKQLSKYINFAVNKGDNVWIAQREGRAKLGIDKTDPTILKMLTLQNREASSKLTLKETINKLHIVPVSISYEYDPCAEMKARELFEIDKNGHFTKNEDSDINTISEGLNGEKGDIYVCFGKEIIAIDDNPVNIAQQIDQEIILNYKLHASNYLAYEKLRHLSPSIGPELNADIELSTQKREDFDTRYKQMPMDLKPYFLKMYANPVIERFFYQA